MEAGSKSLEAPSREQSGNMFFFKRGAIVILSLCGIVIFVKLMVHDRCGHGEAKIAVTKIKIASLETALNEFKTNAGRYPANEEGLEALIAKPASLTGEQWCGPYLAKPQIPTDGW